MTDQPATSTLRPATQARRPDPAASSQGPQLARNVAPPQNLARPGLSRVAPEGEEP